MQLLAPASSSWDLVDVEFAHSHREGWLGRAFAGGKQLLQAAYREALEPQRAINHQLVDFTTRVIKGRDEKLMAEVKAQVDRTRQPHSPTAAARAFEQMVGPVMATQREWNRSAFELLEATASGRSLSLEQVHFMLGKLTRWGAGPAAATGKSHAAFEQWRKLFAKQAAFNRAVAATLGFLHGIPRPPDRGNGYPELLLAHEARRSSAIAQALGSLTERPLISITTPTWETPAILLRECIDSVLAQSYVNWELCIADDGSKGPEVRAVLAEYDDNRIRHQLLPVNGGIARATNAALQMARGAYVGFLDHDDTLAPNALAEVVLELDRAPETDFLFSDEDRLDLQGRRNLPFFKAGWSPDMLMSGNYVCHFLVVRRTLIEQVGRIREGFDGAQDFDLVLRLWESTSRIRHIPEVLYHWRATPLSTAVNVENKPQAGHAGARALAEHLVRCQVAGQVFSPASTQYHVRYLVVGSPRVVLVTAPKTSAKKWAQLFSFARSGTTDLVVVGAAPVDGARLVKWEAARDVGAMYARAVAEHPADVYLFLDEELEPADPTCITELVAQATRPEIGVVGARLLYADSTIREAGLWAAPDGSFVHPFQHMADDGNWTTIGNANFSRNFIAVSGACFAARSDVIAIAGGFSSGNSPELGLCAQARIAGLRILSTPFARFTHLGLEEEHASSSAIGADPYLNPNVDFSSTNGGIRRR